jgi:hypothetical protein
MYPLYPIHNTFFQNVQNSHPGRTFQALDSKRRREVLREFLEAVVLSLPTTVFLFGTIHGLQAARLAALSKAKCEVKNKFQKTGKGWKDGKGKKHKKKRKKVLGSHATPAAAPSLRPRLPPVVTTQFCCGHEDLFQDLKESGPFVAVKLLL